MLLTAISANIELSAKIKAELILFHNSKSMMTSKFMALTENLVSFEQQTEEMTQDTGFWNKLTKVAESSKEAATHLTTQTTDKLGNAAKSSMEVLANTASKTGEAIGQATTSTLNVVEDATAKTGSVVSKVAAETASFTYNAASKTGETLGQATTNTVHAVGNVASQTGELAGKITTETASFVANTASQTGEAIGQATTNTVHAVGNVAVQAATGTSELVQNAASVTGDIISNAATVTVNLASEAGHIVTNTAGDVLSGVAKGTSIVTIWTLSQFAEGLMDGVKSSFASGFGLPGFCLLLGLIFIYRFVFKRPSKKVVYSYLGQSDSSSVVNDSSLIETPENDVTR
jgi:hypothetical protein